MSYRAFIVSILGNDDPKIFSVKYVCIDKDKDIFRRAQLTFYMFVAVAEVESWSIIDRIMNKEIQI